MTRSLSTLENVNEFFSKNSGMHDCEKYAENDNNSAPVLNLFFNVRKKTLLLNYNIGMERSQYIFTIQLLNYP